MNGQSEFLFGLKLGFIGGQRPARPMGDDCLAGWLEGNQMSTVLNAAGMADRAKKVHGIEVSESFFAT